MASSAGGGLYCSMRAAQAAAAPRTNIGVRETVQLVELIGSGIHARCADVAFRGRYVAEMKWANTELRVV